MSVDLSIQTVFVPVEDCLFANRPLTQAAIEGGENAWDKIIVPATGVTSSSCYPSQFVASALATTSLPPFSQLICPQGWESYYYNHTYVGCCPYDYGLYPPYLKEDIERPFRDAVCTSSIWPGLLYDVTSYDAQGSTTVRGLTAPSDGVIAYATCFDGVVATTTLSTAATPAFLTTSDFDLGVHTFNDPYTRQAPSITEYYTSDGVTTPATTRSRHSTSTSTPSTITSAPPSLRTGSASAASTTVTSTTSGVVKLRISGIMLVLTVGLSVFMW